MHWQPDAVIGRAAGPLCPSPAGRALAELVTPPKEVTRIPLPDWAADLGIGSPPQLLVDARSVLSGEGPAFGRCDWWLAAGLHIAGAFECAHEAKRGPIQSFAFRLSGVDGALFDRAWANRILLFLRRSAARARNRSEEDLFGPLPAAEILLTHDVDAFTRRWELRLKQSSFHLANMARLAARGHTKASLQRLAAAVRFATGPSISGPSMSCSLHSIGAGSAPCCISTPAPPGGTGASPAASSIPAIISAEPRIATLLQRLLATGFEVGLHSSGSGRGGHLRNCAPNAIAWRA